VRRTLFEGMGNGETRRTGEVENVLRRYRRRLGTRSKGDGARKES